NGARPTTKTDSLQDVLRRLRPANIVRIELIRGGAGGVEMQGHPVVANIVLQAQAQTDRVVEVGARAYGDGSVGGIAGLQWTRRLGLSETEVSAQAARETGRGAGEGERTIQPVGGALQAFAIDQTEKVTSGSLRAAVQRPTATGKYRVNALVSSERSQGATRTNPVSGGGSGQVTENDEDERSLELGGRLDRRLASGIDLALTGLQTLSKEEETEATRQGGDLETFGESSLAGESIVRAVGRLKRDAWTFEAGGEAAYNFLDSDTRYAENGVDIPLPSASVKVEEKRAEVFGTVTWQGRPGLSVDAGGRLEVSEISQSGDASTATSFFFAKPRVLVTWSPAEGRQWRVRLEREVGQLDFGDFVSSAQLDLGQINAGNPDLQPSRAWVLETVYERRFWTRGVFSVTALASRIDNVNDQLSVGGFNALGDIGVGDRQRLVAALSLPLDKFGLPGARLDGKMGWAASQVTDPATGQTRRLSSEAGRFCDMAFIYDMPGGRWSWGGEYECAQTEFQFRTDQLVRVKSAAEADVFVEWKAGDRLAVRLDVYNALIGGETLARDIYRGSRDAGALTRNDVRTIQPYRVVALQLRRTF
ncbi:MAG: TonB-dependent receptor, partial [Caulobacterales bacterium]|nr:TonB-dependent receptor [Caulobacterales bacterium]